MSKQAKTREPKGNEKRKEAGRVEWDSRRKGGRTHSSFLPHNGLHFVPQGRLHQHSLARALRKYWFLFPRTNSIKGREVFREVRELSLLSTFFMARGKSLRSKSSGKTSSVEGTKKSNFTEEGEGDRHIRHRERREVRSTLTFLHVLPRAQKYPAKK